MVTKWVGVEEDVDKKAARVEDRTAAVGRRKRRWAVAGRMRQGSVGGSS